MVLPTRAQKSEMFNAYIIIYNMYIVHKTKCVKYELYSRKIFEGINLCERPFERFLRISTCSLLQHAILNSWV